MKGYRLSKVLFQLKSPENVAALVADPSAARARYELTDEEIAVLRDGDRTRLFELGANPYLIRLVYRNQKTFDVRRIESSP